MVSRREVYLSIRCQRVMCNLPMLRIHYFPIALQSKPLKRSKVKLAEAQASAVNPPRKS
jgi:hypothetical protein